MHVVSLVTQKGGTGKSSLVISLAVAAQERGQKVYVIDLDPQGTAKNWYERREAEWPEVATLEASRLPHAIETLRKLGTDIVFIDTPGIDVPAATAAMQASDLCLIPARPSIADIEATKPTVRSLARLGKSFAFVLNQCPPGRSIRTSDAYRVLQLSGAVAGATVGMRTDHIDAMAQGLGVTERDTNGKAAGEVRDLMQWITTRLEGKHGSQETARVA
jgi:chromosome partitioning protein